ncbi:prepilin-type N-terminal cleavage/methylation domain-containing protein [Candidatus Clostridium radicumherbarum]|uniref:Prepilin-type N-terminal cleavage/methylation domain-containing protein n=1 Tax=Candidatus Clostridium radicumherbarum TaxID=3381662 RepID=A0ABW8TW97_9CLOT
MKKGFSLIELLVIMSIIIIAASCTPFLTSFLQ